MIYQWLHKFSEYHSVFNVFRYITFRTFVGIFTSFVICWRLGPYFIQRLINKQIGQSIRDDGPQSHKKKAGTPTMGGGLMLLGVAASLMLWMDLSNPLVWATLVISFSFGFIGYVDDWLKVEKKNHKGLPGKVRLALEFLIAGGIIAVLVFEHGLSTHLNVPFFKEWGFEMGASYILFGALVIVGAANAVNLTDGLDGLAIVPVVVSASTLAIFAYLAGHSQLARYLQIPFVPGAGELAPVAAAFVGAGLGFLWFNTHPAQIFMGDVGSLSLGGFLGTVAVLTKNELILVVLGGVFVVEALSVITQVISFKATGKRVFKMAPIHHHFELQGLTETKIIVRFWIVSLLLAILSLSTLKLR